jgi:hypothetical protein
MQLRNGRILLSLVGIAFVVLTAWSLRYFSRYQPLTPFSQSYLQTGLGQIGLQAQDVVVVAHANGRRRWRVSAQTITFSRDRRTLSADGIRHGILYDERGKPEAALSAGHAVYSSTFGTLDTGGLNTLRLDTNVRAVVLTSQRPTLITQGLVWEPLRNQLSSPGPLSVTVPRLNVMAGNAVYTLPPGTKTAALRGTLRLGGGIQARVETPHGLVTLDCPGLTWDTAQKIARSLGPVTATIPGGFGTTTAAEMQVDTMNGSVTGQELVGTLRLSSEVQ